MLGSPRHSVQRPQPRAQDTAPAEQLAPVETTGGEQVQGTLAGSRRSAYRHATSAAPRGC